MSTSETSSSHSNERAAQAHPTIVSDFSCLVDENFHCPPEKRVFVLQAALTHLGDFRAGLQECKMPSMRNAWMDQASV
jgi:hypothetical protein